MIRTARRLLLVASLLGAAAAPAMAATSIKARPNMSYANLADVSSGLTGGSYSGVGSVFFSLASTAQTGIGIQCSGALLSSNVVLTAGHCFSGAVDAGGNPDPVTGVTFYLPSATQASPATTFDVASYQVSPTFNGDPTRGDDFALFTLAQAATGVQTYGIYAGDPMKVFTRVGTGEIGGPAGVGTGGVTDDYAQRQGNNLYEYYGDQLDPSWSGNLLLSDFDDGTPEHDAFGRLFGASGEQTGIFGESFPAPGDSGGPTFIDGQIAGISSFFISADAYTAAGTCGGPDSIDPFGPGGTTGDAANAAGCTNGSVGEIAADTWLSPYKNYIDGYVTTAGSSSAVPEPATWAQLLAGMAFIGFTMRRRRAVRVSVATA